MKEKLKNMFESDLSRLILTLSLVIPICLGISSMGCSLGLSVKVDPKYLCDWTRDEQMIKMPGFDRSFIIVPSCDYFEAAKVSIATKLLPKFMQPTNIFLLDNDFPRNINGKIDKKELKKQFIKNIA